MARVLVPLDGSVSAERAVDHAQALAHRLHARLVLVRCALDGDVGEAHAYLDGVLGRFGLDADTTDRVVGAFPPEAIHDLAAQEPGSVLCLASHGRSGLGHYLLGSLSEDILARAEAPAVVVGPSVRSVTLEPVLDRAGARRRAAHDGHGATEGTDRPTVAGWCVDAATDPVSLAPFVGEWAHALDLDVDVLTVRAEDDRPVSRFRPATGRQLAAAVDALHAHGVRARSVVLKEAQPARRLAAYATDATLALLLADKRTSTGGSRDVLGSTSMNLVHQSPCPVVFPPAAEHPPRS